MSFFLINLLQHDSTRTEVQLIEMFKVINEIIRPHEQAGLQKKESFRANVQD